jgi:hypothetical protein
MEVEKMASAIRIRKRFKLPLSRSVYVSDDKSWSGDVEVRE